MFVCLPIYLMRSRDDGHVGVTSGRGNQQVQDASDLALHGSSPAASMPLTMSNSPTSPTAAASTADSMEDVTDDIDDATDVQPPAAFTDLVVERSPAARQPVQPPTAAAPAGKRRPSRFLQRHVATAEAATAEPDVETSSPAGVPPESDREYGDGATAVVEGFGMDVARVTRSACS